jgi:hypothetical protein
MDEDWRRFFEINVGRSWEIDRSGLGLNGCPGYLKLYCAQLLKRFVEVSLSFGEAQEFDIFYTDFARGGLRLEDLHGLIDEVRQRHHPRVSRGAAGGEVGGDGGRNNFDDLHRRVSQLHSERERIGVQGRFGRAIGGCWMLWRGPASSVLTLRWPAWPKGVSAISAPSSLRRLRPMSGSR